MRQHYDPKRKAEVMAILAANGGDIARTELQTGVSERTLYRWRQVLWQTWRRQNPPPSSPKPLPEFEDDLESLAYLRAQIMKEVMSVANTFEGDLAYTTPPQRVGLLTQLLDRLIKLDDHLKPYKPVEPVGFKIDWDPGLYLRTAAGYRGPFTPSELPSDWKQRYGESTSLEFYWGDGTYTLLPDESPATQLVFQTLDFDANPCPIFIDDEDEDEYDY